MSDTEFRFFEAIQGYLDRAGRVINLPDHVATILAQPKNELIVHFPVRMDDGTTRLFKGYRIQHNNLLGPYKGGLRFHPAVSLDDLKALGTMMTWKCALMGIPYGGAKGGVKCNPRELSPEELQRVTRRFTHALGSNIGPEYDIPAPDVGSNGQMMVWIMDTYMNSMGHSSKNAHKHVVTGKTLTCGGSAGREKATAQGLVHCLVEWSKDKAFPLEGKTAIVQGFGNVGSHSALLLSKLGVSTVAVGDHTGYLYNPEGFNPHKLAEHVRKHGSIQGYGAGEEITREQFWSVESDLCIPAAIENQIGEEEARLIKAKVIAEGANGPVHPDGEVILEQRGVEIIPDVLCNSGGVTVSYYEWIQNKRSETWDLEEVDRKLHKRMTRVYHQVMGFARENNVSARIASYSLALLRLKLAYEERGIFP